MKELKKRMWIIVNICDGNPQIYTLSEQRKSTIEAFLQGSDMDWKEVKGYGWKVIKVNMVLTPFFTKIATK